jgi:hypothetical protein
MICLCLGGVTTDRDAYRAVNTENASLLGGARFDGAIHVAARSNLGVPDGVRGVAPTLSRWAAERTPGPEPTSSGRLRVV